MKAIVSRGLGIFLVLLCLSVAAPLHCHGLAVLWGSVLLTAMYTLIRPLMQTLILPLNVLVGGALTPLTDALLVVWAAAWTHGLSLGYWESVLVALAIGLAYLPYARSKRGLGSCKQS